jgi:citrate lyase subunit beta/citryl-CoA lyase
MMATTTHHGAFKLLRSVLFTPADLTKSFEKVLKGSSDCIIFDLEDSIHPDKKAQARDSLFKFLSSHTG